MTTTMDRQTMRAAMVNTYVRLCDEDAIWDRIVCEVTRYFTGPSIEIVSAKVREVYPTCKTPFCELELSSVSPTDKVGRFAAVYRIPKGA